MRVEDLSFYDKLVIFCLLENGPMKAWALSKKIYEKMRKLDVYPRSKWEEWKKAEGSERYQLIFRIYSNLIKKNGNLRRLMHKGLIVYDDESKTWSLTPRGLSLCQKNRNVKRDVDE